MATRISVFTCCALLLCQTASADSLLLQKKVTQVVKVKKVVDLQLQVKKLTKALLISSKKLAKAQKVAASAARELAEAEKTEAAAQNNDGKQAAAKRVEEARQNLANARIVVEKLRVALQKINRTIAISRGLRSRGTVAVREKVDPEDPIERFLILAPGGPLVVEVAITLDGKPFRIAREKLIDEMLEIADKDGEPTWEDAIRNPLFTNGRIRVVNESQRERYIKSLDRNNNGLVDRTEVRQFLAQYCGGPAFTINGSAGNFKNFAIRSIGIYNRGSGQADLQKLLDTDNDGDLSVKEIAAASDRLKSRDADDNDLLELSELSGGASANNVARKKFLSVQRRQMSVLLGPSAQANLLFQSLNQQYQNDEGHIVADSFSAVPKLFERVDKNKNGRLDLNEVLMFNEIVPHIQLTANFGNTDGLKGLSLKALSPKLHKSKESNREIVLELPGVKISLSANLSPPRTTNYERIATTYITRFDKDKNGYLEKKELPAKIARQFELWDVDSDAKVFGKEITAFYNRQQAPQNTQIRASIAKPGNVLFQALDINGDGRLGLREMKTSPQRLKTFDKNKDGKISMDEIPVTISVALAPTRAGYSSLPQRSGSRTTPNRRKTDAPKWFTRMDRNGDGDVTLKEFLGTKEEFEKLDTNGDGFIESKEAKPAKHP